MGEGSVHHGLQPRAQRVLVTVRLGQLLLCVQLPPLQEGEVLCAVLQSVAQDGLQAILRNRQVIFEVGKGDFRLDHPEFCEMP